MRIASHEVARPSAPHSIRTPSSRTSPSAGWKRTGIPVRIRWIASSARTPITESCGPVIPASVIAAVPPGEDARVGGLDVRVRADHRGRLAVEQARERDLLARRLGVEVHDHDRRLAQRLLDELLGDLERRRPRARGRAGPSRLITATGVPSAAGCDGEPAARCAAERFAGRITRSVPLEVGREVALGPGVVAERDHVGAGGEDPLGELGRDPAPVGGVLAVDDAEVDAELLAQRGQAHFHGAPAGRSEDVGEEEDLYGTARVAAGLTCTATWLPESCV